MWFLAAGSNAALDSFHRGVMAVLAQIVVPGAGIEQRIDHGGFLNPAARDHRPHVVGHLV
jgi:hypothetical protein